MTQAITEPTLTLEQVATQFTHWRRTRKKLGKTPQNLIDQAVALRAHYPVSQIIQALGLNHRDYQNHCRRSQDPASAAPIATRFVPVTTTVDEAKDTTLSLTLSHPDGQRLQIQGLTQSTVQHIVQGFWGGERCFN